MLPNHRGFTLLELLLSLVLMATLTTFMAQSMSRALSAKAKIQRQVDEMGGLRDALKVIERDLNLVVHDRDFEEEFQQALKKASVAGTQPGGATTVPGANPLAQAQSPQEQERIRNRLSPRTTFEGTAEKMTFVTSNTSRSLASSTQAGPFVRVRYSVESCKGRDTVADIDKCLVRSMDPWADSQDEALPEQIPLAKGVTELKFRYIGRGVQDWQSTWNSKEKPNQDFPQAVEIQIKTELGTGEVKRKLAMNLVAQIRFPNNAPSNQPGSSPAGAGLPTPGGGGP